MLEQYNRIKREHQGEVLFFRLGDFYEMFADDAIEISALLNLTLTNRNGLPMCGIPYHAVHSYVARLLKFGKKIAICEQLSESGKGLVERKVVEVITPGTTINEDYLEKGSFNYLAVLAAVSKFFSFAFIDLSTGDFHASSFPPEDIQERLRQELERHQIREIIVQESLLKENPPIAAAIEERPGMVVNRWADWLFDRARSLSRLEKQFGFTKLKGFGLREDSPEIVSAGALLDYLDDTAGSLIPHVRTLELYSENKYVGIDEATMRNLELVRNLEGERRFSLLEVMDETKTAMGARLLKRRLLHPLRDRDMINTRLDMVESFYHNQEALAQMRELLAAAPDLERLCSRLAMDKAHGKDMAAIKRALAVHKALELPCRTVSPVYESSEALSLDEEGMSRLEDIRELLEKGLAEDPPILLNEGNLIREGFDPELDRLRKLRDEGRKLLEEYLMEERKSTGISSLKIRYNRLIGYFFEVTKVHLAKVPPHFIRRQGIVGGERYSTERLAELESDINGASDKVLELEKKVFLEIRDRAKGALAELTAAGKRMAELDTAQSLARAATIHRWIRPALDVGNGLRIIDGRHPVVEANLPRGEFIPNDVILDASPGGGVSFALITGPNMAGKSTYLRQAALTVIMAQGGSFVPASEAVIGMADRIYCRVGASDNLARGESTFLVEMNETAYILHTATEKSLVIMDEVGRGTGTRDGLSIARAVCEELLNYKQCRTLFATHYHELSQIVHPRLANRSMETTDNHGEIVFLRRLKEGPAEESYGIHVARLAGLPERVLRRAEEIMHSPRDNPPLPEGPAAFSKVPPPETGPLAEALKNLEPDAMTPMEALRLLYRLKKELDRSSSPAVKTTRSRPSEEEGIPSLFDSL
ncbi:MAG: DNA mismatch repair protein MutS [Treponema sp.]|jgi:DNA mismatch repair protein MutS|nr:DNA mismatch repair protein MutS [Treponema sp.]